LNYIMKITLTFILASLLVIGASAQSKKKKEAEKQQLQQQTQSQPPVPSPAASPDTVQQVDVLTQHFYRKYTVAVQWGDEQVAKDALYDLIIRNPGNDSLIYSLAVQYYQEQKFTSSLLVGMELLKRNPKSQQYLELAALSSESVGVVDRALQYYESLYLLSGSNTTLYKIAFLQYDLKRFAESMTNADILLTKPELETMKVTFNDAQNKPKEFPIKVAILNLKGLLKQQMGDNVAAKKLFGEAVAISPDFGPAKENLAKLK
jgi:tetratricopeptide (TPR) repeat protein